ncbi:GNAT family N-acetyltransferase [Solirubrobacter sp. CPCC 204708]|uniref:GNAT family N-acetyltransferase n=1 Tax=Solirubrobacter deserti TaxID=2282478 RepID=A0ABT4REX8_9ACTN|nr:GNAT family protein [Solirubrobacter deserti]MBE2318639.1 GNAT family N-acetyltransferase [Solirubrobacter deserti]MDA0137097.1 GNAT family N-acetyltransferase [Solirubrobacter deserti]
MRRYPGAEFTRAELVRCDAMLRPATPADRDALVALAQHPEIAATLATTAAESLREDTGELLVIEHEHQLVGGVRWVLVNRRSRIADIRTLMIDPAHGGRGLATQAIKQLARHLVADHDIHRVEAEVYGFNTAAQRVFANAGFTEEGRRRQAYDRAGAWQDGVRYGLLAEELAAV